MTAYPRFMKSFDYLYTSDLPEPSSSKSLDGPNYTSDIYFLFCRIIFVDYIPTYPGWTLNLNFMTHKNAVMREKDASSASDHVMKLPLLVLSSFVNRNVFSIRNVFRKLLYNICLFPCQFQCCTLLALKPTK